MIPWIIGFPQFLEATNQQGHQRGLTQTALPTQVVTVPRACPQRPVYS